jgi:glycosyltransferase involved in cell wall biosynthesis
LVQHLPNNVRLMGYLSGEALNNFYSQARFFMMASRCYEGFPMAILEAAKYGKPMIAPDHGGFSEIIGHGEEAVGLLFRPGDADSLETCVRQLWHDAQLTQQLGEKAFAKLKATYSSEVVAQQWKSLLKELH